MVAKEILSVKDGYSLWASCYDDDGNPLIALEGPALREWYGLISGQPVIDLGCGTGRHTAQLISAGANVISCDLTPAMLNRAKQKIGDQVTGWLRLALPGPLPFRDRSFQVAILALVIEHIEPLESTFCEIARILKPGGRCLLSSLHPDLTRQGQTARFIDPRTGLRQPILTVHREIDQIINMAGKAGLRLIDQRSLVVQAELAQLLSRAIPYVGMNLGWVAQFQID